MLGASSPLPPASAREAISRSIASHLEARNADQSAAACLPLLHGAIALWSSSHGVTQMLMTNVQAGAGVEHEQDQLEAKVASLQLPFKLVFLLHHK